MQPPSEPQPEPANVSPEKQLGDAVKEGTTVIHVHNGDVVFYVSDKMFRIGEVEALIVAERAYSSTTTNSPGAATAQGDAANARSSTLQNSAPADFDVLAIELAALRTEMRKRADGSTAHDKALAAIAEGEDSAKAKDEPALRAYLVKAGAWALNVAQEIGVAVAADYIKGLPRGG